LPMMLDAVAYRRRSPLRVHALRGTLGALRAHVFNNVIWPDFTMLPSPETPLLTFREIGMGQCLLRGSRAPKHIEVLPAVHTVPACGYAVRSADGRANWVFGGDSERNPAFWQRVNQLDVGALVIETAFSHNQRELARISRHLSPGVLVEELGHIGQGSHYPVYITHTKPDCTHAVMAEIEALSAQRKLLGLTVWDIRRLKAGDVLVVP
ncbi:MAG: 3,5-cyclic-nucleotide phosphodiesterase, partial [Variovorax sp.]|nr:3,5-cyclic-nucleotide phosphodiesterase [Variovorax sp.]